MTALTADQLRRVLDFILETAGVRGVPGGPAELRVALDVHAARMASPPLPYWQGERFAGIPVVLDATLPPGEVVVVSIARMNLGPLEDTPPAPPSVTADPMASAAADSADWRDTVRQRARRTDPPRGHVGGPAR